MRPASGSPGDEALAVFLRVVVVVTVALAASAVVLPGSAGRGAAWAMVAVLVGTPFIRVAWLAVQWGLRRDWRFLGAGLGVLILTGAGAAVAALT